MKKSTAIIRSDHRGNQDSTRVQTGVQFEQDGPHVWVRIVEFGGGVHGFHELHRVVIHEVDWTNIVNMMKPTHDHDMLAPRPELDGVRDG